LRSSWSLVSGCGGNGSRGAALLTGAATLLTLAAINPDAYIAQHNVDRFEQTGKADWGHLCGLSADAAEALDTLPERYRSCVTTTWDMHDDWLEWNLGRSRAADLPSGTTAYDSGGACASTTEERWFVQRADRRPAANGQAVGG
jgi:two-component system sensor histidine kinase BaeS